jgi:hypothetical protein
MIKYYKIACFLFCLLFVIGCKKKNDESSSFHASFQAVINNVETSINESGTNYWSSTGGSSANINGSDSSLFQFEMSLWQYYKSDSIFHNSIFIDFINHLPNDSLDHTNHYPDLFEHTFRYLLRIGSYPYTYDSYLKSGIIVSWFDNQGLNWVSGKVRGENNGFPSFQPDYSRNNFSITYTQPVAPYPSFYSWGQEVVIKFSCWVYNYYGDSLRIENAELHGIYSYRKM